MKDLKEYIFNKDYNYTFEEFCKDNNIQEDEITDETHRTFVCGNWNNFFHRPYRLYKSNLYESILKSYNALDLYKELFKNFGEYLIDGPIFTDNSSSLTKSFGIRYIEKDFVNTKKFQQLLNFYNYTFTFDGMNAKEGQKEKIIYLEPNIPDNETDTIYDKYRGIIYHITDKTIYKKYIQKYGLKPKGGYARKYSERVYFTAGNTEKELKENIDEVLRRKADPKNELSIYTKTLLKIDLNKYSNKITLFKDTQMKNYCVWTSEYIPPYCIEEVNIKECSNLF